VSSTVSPFIRSYVLKLCMFKVVGWSVFGLCIKKQFLCGLFCVRGEDDGTANVLTSLG